MRDTGTPARWLWHRCFSRRLRHAGTGSDGNTYRFTTHAVGLPKDYTGTGDNTIIKSTYQSDKRGWYLDLPESGERVVADARFAAAARSSPRSSPT